MRVNDIAFYPWMKLNLNKHASKLSNMGQFEPKLNLNTLWNVTYACI